MTWARRGSAVRLLAAGALAAAPACGDDNGNPCARLTCQAGATCVFDGYYAFCSCEPGRDLVGGRCVGPDGGDAGDGDAAGDGDDAGDGAAICPAGRVACASGCADLASDPENCGGCGAVCGDPLVCASGRCATSCPWPLDNCSRACVDLRTDPTHCRYCFRECAPTANAHPWCNRGDCEELCLPGYVNADGEPGCECEYRSADEACNGADDDCDTTTDEGFECRSGDPMACTTTCGTTGAGACTDACTTPPPESCTPPPDVCNSIDDDCDGNTNCMSGAVPCTPVCIVETDWCSDGVDNDLNGATDCDDSACCSYCGLC